MLVTWNIYLLSFYCTQSNNDTNDENINNKVKGESTNSYSLIMQMAYTVTDIFRGSDPLTPLHIPY